MAKNFDTLANKVLVDPERAARVAEYREEMERALTLAELRKARQLTQDALAQSLETNQSGVSRIERQTDLYVSTLGRYVEALGGHLEIRAVFPEGQASVCIGQFSELEDPQPAT